MIRTVLTIVMLMIMLSGVTQATPVTSFDVVNLPHPNGARWGIADAINGNGDIVGRENFGDWLFVMPTKPVVWMRTGQIKVLSSIYGVMQTIPSDINDLGMTVGSAGKAWTPGNICYCQSVTNGIVRQLGVVDTRGGGWVLGLNNKNAACGQIWPVVTSSSGGRLISMPYNGAGYWPSLATPSVYRILNYPKDLMMNGMPLSTAIQISEQWLMEYDPNYTITVDPKKIKFNALAEHIGDDGQIVGWSGVSWSGFSPRLSYGIVWNSTGKIVKYFPSHLDPKIPSDAAYIYGISPNGKWMVGWDGRAECYFGGSAFIWDGVNPPTYIPVAPQYHNNIGYRVNNNGEVLGYSYGGNSFIRHEEAGNAFYWSKESGSIQLPMPSGGSTMYAQDIGPDGTIVGGVDKKSINMYGSRVDHYTFPIKWVPVR